MRGVETMDEKEKIKYIVAFTYGDGYIGQHGKECRFEANNIEKNMDYMLWRKEILENITPVNFHPNIKLENHQQTYKTCTRTHPMYTKVHNRMYLLGKKVIDPHYLKLMDWETLAIWYMDDGSIRPNIRYYKDKTYYCTPTPNLATCCFSYGDNLLLKQVFKQTLGIEFNISKHAVSVNTGQQYILNLASGSFDRFIENIKPFIFPSFEYKLNPYDKPLDKIQGEDIVRTA